MTTIENLAQVRHAVEANPSLVPDTFDHVLSMVHNEADAVRRWCAIYFLDTFTRWQQPDPTRKDLAIRCLGALRTLLNDTDTETVENSLFVAANVYPLVFSQYCENQGQTDLHEHLATLKQKCNSLWDSSSKTKNFAIEMACIKFGQQIVSVQSYGSRDPRRADTGEISLISIPTGHPLSQEVVKLEAESTGYLDKILRILTDPVIYAPKVTCAMHALCSLLKTRESTHKSIMRILLEFDPLAKNSLPGASDLRTEMELKFIDKSLKLLFLHLSKQQIMAKFHSRLIQKWKMLQERKASANLKKRMAEAQDDAGHKRPKLESRTTPINSNTAMPAGPVSYTTLFNLLAPGDNLESFNVKELPLDIAINIAYHGISAVNPMLLKNSEDVVKQRMRNLFETSKQASIAPVSSDQYPIDTFGNDDSDYEPNFGPKGDSEEVSEDEDEDLDNDQMLMPASEFSLPPVEPLSDEKRLKVMGQVVERLIGYGSITSDSVASTNKSIDRLAVTEWKKDTWITFASRLLTRGVCQNNEKLRNEIRQHIFKYVMANYREHLDVILSWLTEEWYNEFVVRELPPDNKAESIYYQWTDRLFDAVIPLTEGTHLKSFLRLLSDLPEISRELIFKFKSLCMDPDRLKVGFTGLQFLIMLRPPCKEYALELLDNLYRSGDADAKGQAEKLLKKFKPEALQAA